MSAIDGYSVRLVRNGVAVAQVRDVRGPALKQDAIDVTTRDDAGDDQFIGGLREGGEVTFDLIYDPDQATHAAFPAAIAAGTVAMIEVQTTALDTLKPGGLRAFGVAIGFEPGAPMRDALTADVTYRLTSTPAGIDYLVNHAGDNLVTSAGKYLIV